MTSVSTHTSSSETLVCADSGTMLLGYIPRPTLNVGNAFAGASPSLNPRYTAVWYRGHIMRTFILRVLMFSGVEFVGYHSFTGCEPCLPGGR